MSKQFLLATDLSFIGFNIGLKAQHIAHTFEATLHIVHVIEPPVLYGYDFAANEALLKTRLHDAQKSLTIFSQELGISSNLQHLVMGMTKVKILDVARSIKAELIILGSHGVSGYTHALGSTAQSIVNTASCDVLTINVKSLSPLVKPKNESYFVHPGLESPSHFKPGYVHSLAPKLKDVAQHHEGPKHSGSKKGIAQALRPKPGLRPPHTPYGRPSGDKEDENNED